MRSEFATATWKAAGLVAVSFVAACSGSSLDGKGAGGAEAVGTAARGGSAADAGGGGNSGSSAMPGDLPVCGADENNLSVWGFGSTPMTMLGKVPVLGLTGPLPGAAYIALLFQVATDGGSVVTVNLTSASADIASGKDLTLGNGAKLQVFGLTTTAAGGTTNFSCTGDSGEARINSLSVYRVSETGPKDLPDQENVSFVVNCTGTDTKPVGVTQVRGCYNLVK